MTIDDCFDAIQRLSGISDLVAQYLDAQLYRIEFDTEDQIDIQELMIKCYAIILGELQEKGITILSDMEVALSSIYVADGYVALYQLLDIDYLKDKFSNNTELLDMIRNVFYTDDTDNDIEVDESNYIHDFLDTYKVLFKYDELTDIIDRIEDNIVSNSQFKKHIEAILTQSLPKPTVHDGNIKYVTDYIKGIVKGRLIFSQAINYLQEQLTDEEAKNIDSRYLETAIEKYDLEKVTGTDVAKYAWAVTEKEENLSEEQKVLQKEIIFQHTSKQTHHIEYYISNDKRPTYSQLMELTCHHAEPDSTRDDFIKEVKEMMKKGKESNILTDEDLKIISRFANILLQGFYQNNTIEWVYGIPDDAKL